MRTNAKQVEELHARGFRGLQEVAKAFGINTTVVRALALRLAEPLSKVGRVTYAPRSVVAEVAKAALRIRKESEFTDFLRSTGFSTLRELKNVLKASSDTILMDATDLGIEPVQLAGKRLYSPSQTRILEEQGLHMKQVRVKRLRDKGYLSLSELSKATKESHYRVKKFLRLAGIKATYAARGVGLYHPKSIQAIESRAASEMALPDGRISKIEAAWLAGIIDGEGSIRIVQKARFYYGVVAVSNSDRAIIQKISGLFDHLGLRYSKGLSRKTGNEQLSVGHAQSIVKLLETILPYLVKRGEAKLVIEEARTVIENRFKRRRKWGESRDRSEAVRTIAKGRRF